MRVALVHDYLNQAGGAERVLCALHRLFPDAPIFTTIVDRSALWPALRNADIRTSWMQRLPGVEKVFRAYLPLYPVAVEGLDLRAYDLVISSSSAFAHGARTRPDAVHLCYSHTPMRFVWDYRAYVERQGMGPGARAALAAARVPLRAWDRRAARRPTHYLANSSITAARIQRAYGRSSTIVPPPVHVDRFVPGAGVGAGDYYLVVTRLNRYKQVDLAIEACNRTGRRLVVVGDGPDRDRLLGLAGPGVRLAGRVADEELCALYQRCRGLILPGEEDFGIAPLEANAAGRPVIAYRAGGALDTVQDGHTGVLFNEPTPESLAEGLAALESKPWDPALLRAHALNFDETAFQRRMRDVVATWTSGAAGVPLDAVTTRRLPGD